ncbi:odorant binding protein [Diachasma alloeum]|uniref:Odorant binding protein n=1 Tax=Diachasma alloeum TaxID=454923 RepID=A0A4E0RNT3_9HYME|nr:odorant binding protein [Diachasma alloeum]
MSILTKKSISSIVAKTKSPTSLTTRPI